MHVIMNENFYQFSGIIEKAILNEKPLSVLEISGYGPKYGRLISDCMKRGKTSSLREKKSVCIDRIDLAGVTENEQANVYNNIMFHEVLSDISRIKKYDMIVIMHLFENLDAREAREILEALLRKVKKEILVLTPEYPYDINTEDSRSHVRSYHPIFFRGLDFSYSIMNVIDERWQVYSFFPLALYAPLSIDILPSPISEKKKLRVAYILPHHNLTGGMKALLQQMKELTRIGHIISAYYRADNCNRAIPPWSHLSDEDVYKQVVIPHDESFLSHIKDVDVIILGWMMQLLEFKHCDIPVVLWEQGSEYIYGDYGKLLMSNSVERLNMHTLYRLPVHLLSVSPTIQDILKGVYNRESQFFPNGIDTDFYYPLQNKDNIVPVILLVGSPALSFKGFEFALKVLTLLVESGRTFEVWWASQHDFSVSTFLPFKLKKFIALSQDKLAELYRNADIFLSTSLYESFPLPPIEAMASGVAVVATDNGGIHTYAKPGENCLLSEQSDINSTFIALSYLLEHPEQRAILAQAGRETALEYSFDKVTLTLEECLYRIVEGSTKK